MSGDDEHEIFLNNIRRWGVPLFLTVVLTLAHLISFPTSLQEVATLSSVDNFDLNFPLIYLVFEPFFGLADALTLGVLWPTLISILWFVVLLAFVKGWGRRIALFGGVLLFTLWVILIPRPMAWITASDPDSLIVDFHSHTQASHDGRAAFSIEDNAQWHADQGFNASFLTDHNEVTSKNTGPFALAGEEISLYRMSFILLSPQATVDRRIYKAGPNLIKLFIKDMHKRGLLVIGVLPYYWTHHWDKEPILEDFIRWGVDGFEISNGAPRALNFPLQHQQKIRELSRRHNLILTGVSDNHGYGSAVPSWSVMRLPGWRSFSPDELQAAIVNHLAQYRFDAVRVLERPRFRPANSLELALSPFGIAFVYARTLSWAQTISWIFWIWGLAFLFEFLKIFRSSKKLDVSLPARIEIA